MKTFFWQQRLWLWPLLAMIAIAPFTPWLDVTISSLFFQHNAFASGPVVTAIYKYGLLPGQITFVAAALVFLGSYIIRSWKPWRKPVLIMILTMVIGAGLLTNMILKDHWGRPRPKQTTMFGGQQEFRPFYHPNFFAQPEPSRSFPSGHCAMGFYFFTITLIALRTGHRTVAGTSFVFALVLGGLLALARIAQGGHFFSDALTAALIMWLTAYICTYAFFDEPSPNKIRAP
jgi:membrane-associated PAP2 superfamily phosphatase